MNIKFLLGDASAKGGIEKVTLTLAAALGKIHQTSVISLYSTNKEVSFCNDYSNLYYLNNNKEVSMYNRPYKGFFGVVFDCIYILLTSMKLRKSLRNESVDIIVSCDIKMTLLAKIASLFTGQKVVAIEHFEYDVPNSILKKIRKILYRKISAVVIQTNEDVAKYNWLDSNFLHVIPNIVNVKHSDLFSDKKNEVIAVGRLTHQKGFDLLINAWNKISDKFPDWTLKIYGDGEDEVELSYLVDLCPQKNVKLYPFTSDIDSVYQSAKVFVLSSRFEGLGMVLIEALAHKLACISYDCPAGPKTIIKNNYNGILVKTGDVDELAIAIDELLSNKPLQERYSLNAQQSIIQFSEKRVVMQWNKLLDDTSNEK